MCILPFQCEEAVKLLCKSAALICDWNWPDDVSYSHEISFRPTWIHASVLLPQTKIVVLAALMASASAFAPAVQPKQATALFNEKADWEKASELGWSMGGEDYTRKVEPKKDADPRKTIHEGPSFEEYMKQRAAGGN